MKDITTLINQHAAQPDYTREQKLKVRDFVASVFSLFADYRGEFTNEDFFKEQCRVWVKEISAMSEKEYQERLDKIKMMIAVPNTKYIRGNYKTPNSALAIACMPIEHLNHDYGIAYGRSCATGELERIKESDSVIRNPELAIKSINNLKELFK